MFECWKIERKKKRHSFCSYLWWQQFHRLGMKDLRSVHDRQIVTLGLFILQFVFHLVDRRAHSCLGNANHSTTLHQLTSEWTKSVIFVQVLCCGLNTRVRLTSLAISEFCKRRSISLSSVTGITQPFSISLSYLYSTWKTVRVWERNITKGFFFTLWYKNNKWVSEMKER